MSATASRYLQFGNVFRIGWEDAARNVFRAARTWTTARKVLVAPDGIVYATRAALDSKWTTASGDFLGNYSSQTQVNEIEDDLLAYFQELTARRAAA